MIGGNAALDFVNTASKWSSAAPVDRLDGAAGFAEWARIAGLLDEAGHDKALAAIQNDPAGAAALYEEAQRFRAALRRIFEAAIAQVAPSQDDLALLGRWRAEAARHSVLAPVNGKIERRLDETAPALERPLFAIAEAAESLLVDGPLERIHACGGERCEWMFVDLSRNGRRRWCSMATCGNEAKVKEFRLRKKRSA